MDFFPAWRALKFELRRVKHTRGSARVEQHASRGTTRVGHTRESPTRFIFIFLFVDFCFDLFIII